MAAIGLAADLLPGNYKGVKFLAIRSTITGGRKTVIKKFPNSDKQLVEDLGLDVKSFRMDIVTTTDSNADQVTYFNNRDTLLSKLDDGEKGTLSHPFAGLINDVVVINYTLIEDMTRIGEARYTVNFAISDTTGEPVKSEFILSEISSKVDTANAQIATNIEEEYGVSSAFNYKSAIAKVEDIIDGFNGNTSFLQASADEIDGFSSDLAKLTSSITSIVTSPTNLADSIGSLFSTVNGLYATVSATYAVLTKFFDFGDDDEEINTITAQRTEDNTNKKTMNGAMQCWATTYSYLNASQIDFTTVDELDEVEATLEAQFQKIFESDSLSDTTTANIRLTAETVTAISDVRDTVQQFFNDQRTTLRDTIIVDTAEMPTRVLAYQYYGSTDLSETIGSINSNLDNYPFISGDVEVLTGE